MEHYVRKKSRTFIDAKMVQFENPRNENSKKRKTFTESNRFLRDQLNAEKVKSENSKKKAELNYLTVNCWIPPIIANKEIASQKNTIAMFMRSSLENDDKKPSDKSKLLQIDSKTEENFTKKKLYDHKRKQYNEFKQKKGAIYIKDLWDIKHYKKIMKNAEISAKAQELEKIKRNAVDIKDRRTLFDNMLNRIVYKDTSKEEIAIRIKSLQRERSHSKRLSHKPEIPSLRVSKLNSQELLQQKIISASRGTTRPSSHRKKVKSEDYTGKIEWIIRKCREVKPYNGGERESLTSRKVVNDEHKSARTKITEEAIQKFLSLKRSFRM